MKYIKFLARALLAVLFLSSAGTCIHLFLATRDGMPVLWLVPAVVFGISGSILAYREVKYVSEMEDTKEG